MRVFFKRRYVAQQAVTSRLVSTAPPLSLLSWSVDGTGHNYRGCRRRLSLQERIPFLCSTIIEAAPDIVALQDSLPEVAEALCNSHVLLDLVNKHTGDKDLFAKLNEINVRDGTRYEQIGFVRNGRCGYLQLFRRHDSIWHGRVLSSCPSLTAEFTSVELPGSNVGAATTESFTNNNVSNNNNCNNDKKVVDSSDSGGYGRNGIRFVLTNADLSYRGKSLAVSGLVPLVCPSVSVAGCPFTLRVSPSAMTTAGANQRVKGQLDPHREAALTFLSRVARPDVLVGNFLMGRDETMTGYEDAWALAGAPANHERTVNTFVRHRYDAETNYFYFIPTETEKSPTAVVLPEGENVQVGTRIPLNACRGKSVDGVDSSFLGAAVGSSQKVANSESQTKAITAGTHLLKQAEIPQFAGRYQRCFFRSLSSRHHKQQFPFFCRYTRKQLIVLRSFINAPMTAEEAAKCVEGDKAFVRCFAADGYPILVLLS